MTTLKGPGIFLAQFMGDAAPFNSLKSICEWAAKLGFVGVQIPSWDGRCIDLQKAAESKTYADEIRGIVEGTGMKITELSTHLQGQLVAVHPAYDDLFDGFRLSLMHHFNITTPSSKLLGWRKIVRFVSTQIDNSPILACSR